MTQEQAAGAPISRPTRRLAPTLPQLWALVPLVGIFILLSLWPLFPNDLWWHVRVGQWIVENGLVPTTDHFSFTRAGEPWAYQSWLMEVVLFLALRAGHLPLVIFANAVTITAAYGLALGACRQAAGGDTRWAALATVVAATVGLSNWNARPQTLSILLFALSLYLLERHQGRLDARSAQPRSDWALWWLVPIFALWANGHGGFVFGLGLLATYLLAQFLAWLRRQRSFPQQELLVTMLSGAATLLTPLGLGMVDYVLGFLRHPVTRALNVEFLPPTVRTLDGLLFFSFVTVLIGVLLGSQYRPRPHESLRLLLFGALALTARRNEIWFGLVAAPTMAAALYHWAEKRGIAASQRPDRRTLNLAVAALLALLVLLSLPWFRPFVPWPGGSRTLLYTKTPVRAVAFLRDLPRPRRTYHSEAYGSYMIWASPEVPVFVDTRIELYPKEQWDDYLATRHARFDWETILARYQVDTLLLEHGEHDHLIDAATASPNWEYSYEDEQAVIFQHQGAQ